MTLSSLTNQLIIEKSQFIKYESLNDKSKNIIK